WRFLIFPASAGMFVIPPMTTTVLTPIGERRELRCEQRTLMVQAADVNAGQPPVPTASSDKRVGAIRRSLPFIGIAAALLALLGIVWPRLARAARVRRDTSALVR